jgi:hypothetical protein
VTKADSLQATENTKRQNNYFKIKMDKVDDCLQVTKILKDSKNQIKIKMDSCCSKNMSGVKGRLQQPRPTNTIISGFNGKTSNANYIGINSDNKDELFVDDMPNDLVLLSANSYAEDGAVILLPDCGVQLYMDEDERGEFISFIRKYKAGKSLVVKNKTYEVLDEMGLDTEESMRAIANTYFNTKINVTNIDERILAYLLSGFSITSLIKYVENGKVKGLHPEVTKSALHKFASKWGNSPDVLQLAKPFKMGNQKGYMSEKN